MFKKIKKYFLLIPTLILMLLNCVCYGQVIATDSDYSRFFLDPPEDVIAYFDFTDVEQFNLFDFPDFSDYYYQVQCSLNEYQSYISGNVNSLDIHFLVCDFSNSDNFICGDFLTYTTNIKYYNYWYTYYRDSGYSLVTSDIDFRYFYFTPLSGAWGLSSSSFSSASDEVMNPDYYTLYIECEYFGLNSSSSSLNVDVVFNPVLSGIVDRSKTDSNGSEYLLSNFSMHVYNHNNYAIQYTMDILPLVSTTDFVFRYYENDWVYAPNIDSAANFWNQIPQKQQKATYCHYVLPGRTDTVIFNFNQINLVEGVDYVVQVYAARNDYGCASELVVSSVEEVYPELYQVQNTLVYQSQFSMKQYSDVKYDPTNTSNGVLPYDFELGQKYEHSYNAVEKEDGEVDYTGKDVYSDKDSWYHKPIDDNTQGGSFSSSTTSSNGFSNFAKSFQNFFGFIRYMFNFFPQDAKTIFTIGFSAITIIALVKVLFKS